MSDSYGRSAYQPAEGGTIIFPCLIVFFSGFCVMVIELVASRLVSGYIGMSLYTWTSVIGVILAGISLGNYIGGRLADRFESKKLVCVLFLVSAAASLSILGLTQFFGNLTAGWTGTQELWTARVMCVVFGSFLLPGTALGTISPAIVKWALDHGHATGPTVGTIYAWNTVGSIVGTFVTGFVLLSLFEVNTIILVASGGLLAASILFVPVLLIEKPLPPRATVASGAAAERTRSLAVPCVLVFTSGFIVMLVELVASRLVAGHIGQSIYTWTSVIGVILAGLSLGNYLGGQMSAQFDSKQLVGTLFLLSSVSCLALLVTQGIVDTADSGGEMWPENSPWWARVLVTVFMAYFLPAVALGTISPAVAKWALDMGFATGRTVGTVYAWNVFGSIVGTFVTGFYLISTFYVTPIIACSSLLMAVLAAVFLLFWGEWPGRLASLGWGLACAYLSAFALLPAHRFEDAVLDFWPVSLEEINANEADELQDSLGELIAVLQSRDPELDGPFEEHFDKVLETSKELKESLSRAKRDVDDEYDVTASLLADVKAARRLFDFYELEFDRRLLNGTMRSRMFSVLADLYNILADEEQEHIRRVAKYVSRDEEINRWDQYFYKNDFEYYDESNYYTIQVSEDSVDSHLLDDLDDSGETKSHTIRELVLDALIHGYIDLSDLKYLHYEYEHIYASVSHRLLRKHRAAGQDLRVLFLGGGSYTFPRYLSAYYKDIRCDVAEIDRRVTLAVQRAMGLNEAVGKTFLICDDVSGKTSAGSPAIIAPDFTTAATYSQRLLAPLAALKPKPLSPAQRYQRLKERVIGAGAVAWKDEEFTAKDVNYVIDFRQDKSQSSLILAKAEELGIPIIEPGEFDAMTARTSHPNIVSHHGDARQYIMRNKNDGQYDAIYGDAFNDFSVPAHLTTLEFTRDMARLLKPDGVFMANIIDIWKDSRFMGAYWHTLKAVFKHVYVFNSDQGEPGESRSTFVLIGSQVPLKLDDLGDRPEDVKGLTGTLMEGRILQPVIAAGRRPLEKLSFSWSPAALGEEPKREFSVPAQTVECAVKASETVMTDQLSRWTPAMAVFVDPPGEGEKFETVLEHDETDVVFDGDSETRRFVLPSPKIVNEEAFVDLTPEAVVLPSALPSGARLIVTLAPSTHVTLNGKKDAKSFPLPQTVKKLVIERYLDESEFELEAGNLKLKTTFAWDAKLIVTCWDHRVLLTDQFCPVDNLLSNVAATRAE